VLRPIITQHNSTISTHVTYVSHFDIKGTVPGSIVSIMGAGQPLLIGTIRNLLTKQNSSSSSAATSAATMQQQQQQQQYMSLWQKIANGSDKTAPDYSSSSSGNSISSDSCDDDSVNYADAVSSDTAAAATAAMTATAGGTTSASFVNDSSGNNTSSRHSATDARTQQSHKKFCTPVSTTTAIQQQSSESTIANNKSRFTDVLSCASAAVSIPTVAIAAVILAMSLLLWLAYSASSEFISTYTLLGAVIAVAVVALAFAQYTVQYNSSKTGGSSSSVCNGQHVFVLHIPAVPLHMFLQYCRSQQHGSGSADSNTVQIGISHIVVKALGLALQQYSSNLQQLNAAQASIALHAVADNQPAAVKPMHADATVSTQSDSSMQQIAVSSASCINIDAIAQALSTNTTNTVQSMSNPVAVVITKRHNDDSYRDSTAASCDSDTSSSVASVKHANSSNSTDSSDVSMAFRLPVVPTAKVVVTIGDLQMFSAQTSTATSTSSSRSTSNASSSNYSAQIDQHSIAAANSTAMLQLTVMIDSSIDVYTAHAFVRSFKRYLRNPKRLLLHSTNNDSQANDSSTSATNNSSVYRNQNSSVVLNSAATTATVCNGTANIAATTATTANAAAPLR
jgi:hypothetical protein